VEKGQCVLFSLEPFIIFINKIIHKLFQIHNILSFVCFSFIISCRIGACANRGKAKEKSAFGAGFPRGVISSGRILDVD
jgi:hypothetical protein